MPFCLLLFLFGLRGFPCAAHVFLDGLVEVRGGILHHAFLLFGEGVSDVALNLFDPVFDFVGLGSFQREPKGDQGINDRVIFRGWFLFLVLKQALLLLFQFLF